MRVFDILELEQALNVMDIGAAVINEVPIYRRLLDRNLATLHAFEGDPRQIEKLYEAYGRTVAVYNEFLFDGTDQTLYIAHQETGMTSVLRPNLLALKFFNGFERFGQTLSEQKISTKKLDEITAIPPIDFAKLDIQGAELTVLKNGMRKLKDCLAIQLEVSYICLYEDQPSFGEVDLWMRSQGFLPHSFIDIKRWSISPTIFEGNFRIPGNQLLESDIVYVRDPLKLAELNRMQLTKFAAIAHYCLSSTDLCAHILLELIQRGELDEDACNRYYNFAQQSSGE